MSLILEALKKLDREKGESERGVLVVAAAPWPERARKSWVLWSGAVVAVVAGVVAVSFLTRPRATATARPTGPEPSRAAEANVPEPPRVARVETAPTTMEATAPSRPVRPSPGVALVAAPATLVAAPTPPPSFPVAPARATAPPPASVAPPADVLPKLQAISERDGKPIALVNDRLMREGDEFEGVRILAIRAMEVEVEVHGRRAVLRF